MKLGMTVNVGGFNSMKFESSEHPALRECARDLIDQMQPLIKDYPILLQKIGQLKVAYGL